MEKKKNVKKNCPHIKQLKSFGKCYFFIGLLLISGGLFTYFNHQHLSYQQIINLIVFIVFGIISIIIAVWYFVQIKKTCKYK